MTHSGFVTKIGKEVLICAVSRALMASVAVWSNGVVLRDDDSERFRRLVEDLQHVLGPPLSVARQ